MNTVRNQQFLDLGADALDLFEIVSLFTGSGFVFGFRHRQLCFGRLCFGRCWLDFPGRQESNKAELGTKRQKYMLDSPAWPGYIIDRKLANCPQPLKSGKEK